MCTTIPNIIKSYCFLLLATVCLLADVMELRKIDVTDVLFDWLDILSEPIKFRLTSRIRT